MARHCRLQHSAFPQTDAEDDSADGSAVAKWSDHCIPFPRLPSRHKGSDQAAPQSAPFIGRTSLLPLGLAYSQTGGPQLWTTDSYPAPGGEDK